MNDFDLELAETYWDEGLTLPLDLAAKLMGKGLDVETLESDNRNYN